MKSMRYVILLLAVSGVHIHGQTDRWSWFYSKKMHDHELSESISKGKNLVFCKSDLPRFSQLIFSWNAHRPQAGHLSFFVQTRNATTKMWGKWHRMIDWGANVQKSYVSEGDGHTKYLHVRLEHERNTKSDSFRIKVFARKGAQMDSLQSVAVALSDYDRFEPEHIPSLYRLPSVYVSGVAKISQLSLDHPENKRLCSPTSCWMLANYLKRQQMLCCRSST